MKLLYTLVITLMVLSARGQRPQAYPKGVMPARERAMHQHTKQGELDTLSPGNELNATDYIRFWYGEEEGFVFGSNVFGDDAYGQRFVVDEPYIIHQAIFWIAETAGQTGNVLFTVWDFDETSGPAQVLASQTIALADLTGSLMFGQAPVVSFDPPLEVTRDYVIGVDYSDLDEYSYSGSDTTYSLTYGLVQVSTADGDGGQLGYAWIRNQQAGWLNVLDYDQMQYDVDIAIYPLVTYNTTGQQTLPGQREQYRYYPNPAVERLHVEGDQLIREIRILDLTGRQVVQLPVNDFQVVISLDGFHSGIYFLKIVGEKGIKTQKIQVVK